MRLGPILECLLDAARNRGVTRRDHAMLIYQPPKVADHIPIVDLEASFSGNVESAREVAWEIHKASRETGFFYVRNHGIDQALITDQFSWKGRFFDLSTEEKCRIHMRNSPTTMGYEPMGGSNPTVRTSRLSRPPRSQGKLLLRNRTA